MLLNNTEPQTDCICFLFNSMVVFKQLMALKFCLPITLFIGSTIIDSQKETVLISLNTHHIRPISTLSLKAQYTALHHEASVATSFILL